ncbi:hypothetical protein, partial [Roseiconus lacunae]
EVVSRSRRPRDRHRSPTFADTNCHVIDFINTVATIIGTTMLTFVVSIAGLLPTARLYRLRRGPLCLIHLLSLQLIIALIFAYVSSFLPEGVGHNRLALNIGLTMVGMFWWKLLARWTIEVRDPFRVSIYLTSTVLFAFLCPMMVLVNFNQLFDRIHPTMTVAPALFVVIVHVALYCLVFWTTSWFISLPTTAENGEPCRAPKDGS